MKQSLFFYVLPVRKVLSISTTFKQHFLAILTLSCLKLSKRPFFLMYFVSALYSSSFLLLIFL